MISSFILLFQESHIRHGINLMTHGYGSVFIEMMNGN